MVKLNVWQIANTDKHISLFMFTQLGWQLIQEQTQIQFTSHVNRQTFAEFELE